MSAWQVILYAVTMAWCTQAEVAPSSSLPLECQPVDGPYRHVPIFHVIAAMQNTSGVLLPGDLNDANAVFEHMGIFHVMFQTPRDPFETGGGGSGPHAWGHVISHDLVHWKRLPPVLAPTNDSKEYDGKDGDCDGTLSFLDGVGPILLWSPDCADSWHPPDLTPLRALRGSMPGLEAPQPNDYPRVAVARPANVSDPLLAAWVKDSRNPIAFANMSFPCAFPGPVWRAQGRLHLVCGEWGADTQDPEHPVYTPWARYSTTDESLHGPWHLADGLFAQVPGTTRSVTTVSNPSLLQLVDPQPGEPTHIINCDMGTAFCLADFDEQGQRLVNISGSQRVDNGQWYATGMAERNRRILHIGWVNAWNNPASEKLFSMMSSVRVLSYDRTIGRLVANPTEEIAGLRNGTLHLQRGLLLPAGEPQTLPLPAGAGASVDLELALALPAAGPFSFAVQVLASPTGWAGNATTLSINVTAPPPGGGLRQGLLTQRTSRAAPVQPSQSFTMLDTETEIKVRMLVDRSIIESFVAGGRAVLTNRDYPAEGESSIRLLAAGKEPVTVKHIGVWSMGCGWQ